METLLKILNEINPDVNYEKENALMEDGIFDSMELLELIVAIGENFEVEIDAEEITIENFNSIYNIMALIEKTKNQ